MSVADKRHQWETAKKYLDYLKDLKPKQQLEFFEKLVIFEFLAVKADKKTVDSIKDKYLFETLLPFFKETFIAPLFEKIEKAYQIQRTKEFERQRLLDEKMSILKVEIMAKRNEFTTVIDKERAKLEAELKSKEAVLRKLESEEAQRIKAEVEGLE